MMAHRRQGEMTWMLRTPEDFERLKSLLDRPERQLWTEKAVLKRSDTVVVWEDEEFVLKRWRPHSVAGLFKALFRSSHAKRAFAKACRLASAGISTPTPVAVADRRWWGLTLSSYLVMEKITDAADLGVWQAAGRETMRETARLLARLHAAGFTHRDLKPTNILFDTSGRAYLVDVDGVRLRAQVSDRQAVADLTRLARRMIELASLSPSEAATFLRQYCRDRQKPPRGRWWKAVRRSIARYR